MQQEFNVMIKPIGAQCNLRCQYCFYLEKNALYPHKGAASFRMSDSVLEEAVRSIIAARGPKQREVLFAWQGGEPSLLGRDFFAKALALQMKYAPAGVSIRNSLQTNGTLLSEDFCRFLKDAGFLVGISVDGPRALHDIYRRDITGRGSFDTVMRGIDALNRHAVPYNLLTVVNRDNSQHPEEVYRLLTELGSAHLQFIPLVEPDIHSIVSPRSVTGKQWGIFLQKVFTAWARQDIGRIHVQHFEMLLGIVLGAPPSLCVHAACCGHAVALEHNGDLYSCDHFVDTPHLLGNITHHPLPELLNSPTQQAFGSAKSDSLPQTCRNCSYLALCHGACPKDRLITTDTKPLNWLCEGYRAFYEFSLPHFIAMANCLRMRRPASDYSLFPGSPQLADATHHAVLE